MPHTKPAARPAASARRVNPLLVARLRAGLRTAAPEKPSVTGAPSAPAGQEARDAALLVLKGFAATMRSLLGTDAKESPLILFVKGASPSPAGVELAQDVGLLAVELIEALANDLKDGRIEGPEAFASVMGLMDNVAEIVSDSAALGS
jgi:hypothetical protein